MYDRIPAAEDNEIFAAQLEHLGWATLTPFLTEEPEDEVDDLMPPSLDSEQVNKGRAA